MNSRNNRTTFGTKLRPLAFVTICLVAACLFAVGCTVIPKQLKTAAPSFDACEQNSGLVGMLTNHTGVITPHARDRYNELIKTFGTRFQPPLVPDAGVTPYTNGTFRIDPEHLVKFATMNRWRKEQSGAP